MRLYNWFRRKPCEMCGAEIAGHQGNARWCSACRPAATKERNRLQRIKYRRLAKVGKVA